MVYSFSRIAVRLVWLGLTLLAIGLFYASPVGATQVRLKELVNIEGVRENQLVGYGLVVGLNGTGDKRQTVFAAQTLANALNRMGVNVSPTAMQVKNVAAVMLTATLPAFAQPGTAIDVTVAAIGDASNLQGGQLLLAPLRGADGQVYASAQGAIVTTGFVAGRAGNSLTVNHPTAGRIMNGGTIERASPTPLNGQLLRLQLRRGDFTTAARIAEAVNQKLGQGQWIARAESAGVVEVIPPPQYSARTVEFLAAVEAITVDSDRKSRIVINERTGTIVMGKEIRIAPVSILHGTLEIEIQTNIDVSQPAPLSNGQTTAVVTQRGGAKEDKAKQIQLPQGASVEDLVRGLQAIGATPREVIAVLQNLKSAGAIESEIEVI